MIQTISNPCIRCGKQRIDLTTFKEVIGTSVVIHTQTVCPDSDCQKKVEVLLEKEEEKRMHYMAANLARINQKKVAVKS